MTDTLLQRAFTYAKDCEDEEKREQEAKREQERPIREAALEVIKKDILENKLIPGKYDRVSKVWFITVDCVPTVHPVDIKELLHAILKELNRDCKNKLYVEFTNEWRVDSSGRSGVHFTVKHTLNEAF